MGDRAQRIRAIFDRFDKAWMLGAVDDGIQI